MAIIAGLLAILAIFLYGLWLWPALQFLKKYRAAISENEPHNRSEKIIAGLTVHIYDPVVAPKAVLIVITGLHPNGIFDPRFVGFGRICSEAGFQVVALDIEEYRKFRLSVSTFDKALSAIDALPSVLGLHGKKVGVLGISYAAGPAFAIAAKNKIDFLVSIGGYYNLEHAIEFSFTGIHGETKRQAHEWGRLIFALNHTSDLVDQKDSSAFTDALELRLQLKDEAALVKESELSNDARKLLNGIVNGLTEDQTNLFRDIARKREKEARKLSPEMFLNSMNRNTILYLLHGVSDDSIPYEESIELRDAAKKAGFQTHCLVTTGLTHVDVTSPAHLIEFIKMLHWIRLLLREC